MELCDLYQKQTFVMRVMSWRHIYDTPHDIFHYVWSTKQMRDTKVTRFHLLFLTMVNQFRNSSTVLLFQIETGRSPPAISCALNRPPQLFQKSVCFFGKTRVRLPLTCHILALNHTFEGTCNRCRNPHQTTRISQDILTRQR